MYMVCMVILIFFAVIGVSHFIIGLYRLLLDAHDGDGYILVVPKMKPNSTEIRLRKAVSASKRLKNTKIICICDSNDDETKAIIEFVKKDYKNIEISVREKHTKKSD